MPVVARCFAFKTVSTLVKLKEEHKSLAEFIRELPFYGAYTALRTAEGRWMSLGLHCERILESARCINSEMVCDSSKEPLLLDTIAAALEQSLKLLTVNIVDSDKNTEFKAILFLLGGSNYDDYELHTFVEEIKDPFNPHLPIQVSIYGSPRKNPSCKNSRWISDRRYITDRKPVDVTEMILHSGDQIYEGTVSNFWVFKKRTQSSREGDTYVLQTAPFDLVLKGVISRLILQVVLKMGITMEFSCPRISEFDEWIGCFTTNALKGITPIKRIEMLENQGCFCEFSEFSLIFNLQNQLLRSVHSIHGAC